jgi:hypothetical protein
MLSSLHPVRAGWVRRGTGAAELARNGDGSQAAGTGRLEAHAGSRWAWSGVGAWAPAGAGLAWMTGATSYSIRTRGQTLEVGTGRGRGPRGTRNPVSPRTSRLGLPTSPVPPPRVGATCRGRMVQRVRREWLVDQYAVRCPGYIPPSLAGSRHDVHRSSIPARRAIHCQNRFLRSSMVEHSAVNRRVVGSSPTGGAISFIFIYFNALR